MSQWYITHPAQGNSCLIILGWKDPLEAWQPLNIAWRNPWMGAPGRLKSHELQSWTQLVQLVHTETHTQDIYKTNWSYVPRWKISIISFHHCSKISVAWFCVKYQPLLCEAMRKQKCILSHLCWCGSFSSFGISAQNALFISVMAHINLHVSISYRRYLNNLDSIFKAETSLRWKVCIIKVKVKVT